MILDGNTDSPNLAIHSVFGIIFGKMLFKPNQFFYKHILKKLMR